MAQDHNIQDILPSLISNDLFQDSIPAIDVFDLDYFEQRIKELKTSFNEDFIMHTLAMKANPIKGIVLFAKNHGLGTETASICETLHALSLEIEPKKIVFDSPCKTKNDLEQAMKQGVQITLDNEHEIEMVEELLETICKDTQSSFGLRINPVIGQGTMTFSSTATRASKFGLPILPETKAGINCFSFYVYFLFENLRDQF